MGGERFRLKKREKVAGIRFPGAVAAAMLKNIRVFQDRILKSNDQARIIVVFLLSFSLFGEYSPITPPLLSRSVVIRITYPLEILV